MKRSTRTLQRLYKWSFRTRGDSDVRSFFEEISELPKGITLKVSPKRRLYVFGQPNHCFDGSWRGSSDIETVKWIDSDTIVVTAGNERIILSMEDQL